MSTPQSDCPMVEVCNICGDVGKLSAILICPKCKTNREHIYCRKIYSLNCTDDWCCDECKRPANSVIQQQRSQILLVPKEREAVRANGKNPIQMAECDTTMDPAETQDASLVKKISVPEGASWKGRFDLQEKDFQHTSSEFTAFPRIRCKLKVFEFYKTMPVLLKFKLIPQEKIWRDLFQGEFYGEDEIGLYFFPGGEESSGYGFLLKFIKEGDFAMRCDIGEVELYVFTSNLLPADCQRSSGEYYFWGVLRKVAKHNNVSGAQRGSTSNTCNEPSGQNLQQAQKYGVNSTPKRNHVVLGYLRPRSSVRNSNPRGA